MHLGQLIHTIDLREQTGTERDDRGKTKPKYTTQLTGKARIRQQNQTEEPRTADARKTFEVITYYTSALEVDQKWLIDWNGRTLSIETVDRINRAEQSDPYGRWWRFTAVEEVSTKHG